MPPTLLLLLALGLSGPVTYGVMWVQRERAAHAAYESGKEAGIAEGRASGVAAASATVEARREAEAEVPPVPADKAALIALCKRSASCRERGSLSK